MFNSNHGESFIAIKDLFWVIHIFVEVGHRQSLPAKICTGKS